MSSKIKRALVALVEGTHACNAPSALYTSSPLYVLAISFASIPAYWTSPPTWRKPCLSFAIAFKKVVQPDPGVPRTRHIWPGSKTPEHLQEVRTRVAGIKRITVPHL